MQIRFELMASTRATRSWDADRFELQVGNQALGDDHGGNQDQDQGMQTDSSSWRQPVGNQALGDDHGGNQDQDQGMQSDSSSRWAIKDLGDAVRFELMASTRATRTRTRGCSLIRAHGVNQGNQVLGC